MTPSLPDSDQPDRPAEQLQDPEVLLFQTSPFGTLDAIVQHDGKAVYFYLNQPNPRSNPSQSNIETSDFGTRACWVRNLQPGPLVINESEMKRGISPMLPRTQCVHRDAQPIPTPDQLQIVWFEEGNGAALIESVSGSAPQTLAVIPPWSGVEGFHGYAAECAIESPLCWPMPDNPKLQRRIDQAQQFWGQWLSNPSDAPTKSSNTPEIEASTDPTNLDVATLDPFAELQPRLIDVWSKRFGDSGDGPLQYFSIDGGHFPPCGLVQYQHEQYVVLVTVGMSVCPQPAVELFSDQPSQLRRIELAVRIEIEKGQTPTELAKRIEPVAKQISGLAALPWSRFTWLGPGHTCSIRDIAPNCESALLVSDQQLFASQPSASTDKVSTETAAAISSFRGDPISLLWLLPLSETDLAGLKNQSVSHEDILVSWRKSIDF